MKFERTAFTSRVPSALAENTAFVLTQDQLTLIDTDTGTERATVRPKHKPLTTTNLAAAPRPVRAELDGKPVMVAVFAAQVEGQGTAPGAEIAEVVAVDAVTGHTVASIEVDSGGRVGAVSAIGLSGGILVLGTNRGGGFDEIQDRVFAVDLPTRKTLWSKQNWRPNAVAGDVVVGQPGPYPGTVTALALADGQQRWQLAEVADAKPAAPGFVVVEGKSAGSTTSLVDARTGTAIDSVHASLSCLYDEVDVAVCSSGSGRVSGHEATTGRTLWAITPDAGRLVPQVKTAWHGAIYVETTNGPVVLDARTGADQETAPGAAPYLVNDRFAVATSTAGAEIFRAVGWLSR